MRKFDMSELSAPIHSEANKTIPIKSNQSQQSTYISKSPLLHSNGKGKVVNNHGFNPMFKRNFFFSPPMTTTPYSPSFKQMSSASKIAGASSKFAAQGQQQNLSGVKMFAPESARIPLRVQDNESANSMNVTADEKTLDSQNSMLSQTQQL